MKNADHDTTQIPEELAAIIKSLALLPSPGTPGALPTEHTAVADHLDIPEHNRWQRGFTLNARPDIHGYEDAYIAAHRDDTGHHTYIVHAQTLAEPPVRPIRIAGVTFHQWNDQPAVIAATLRAIVLSRDPSLAHRDTTGHPTLRPATLAKLLPDIHHTTKHTAPGPDQTVLRVRPRGIVHISPPGHTHHAYLSLHGRWWTHHHAAYVLEKLLAAHRATAPAID